MTSPSEDDGWAEDERDFVHKLYMELMKTCINSSIDPSVMVDASINNMLLNMDILLTGKMKVSLLTKIKDRISLEEDRGGSMVQ